MLDTRQMSIAMVQVLIIGAARQDAQHTGRFHEMQSVLVPLLPAYKKDGKFKPLWDAIRGVLGERWEPAGQWAEQIVLMGEPLLADDQGQTS